MAVESASNDLHPDWLDSDDEADAHYQYAAEAQSRRSPNDELELEYRQVTVTGSAFATYRAILLWLHCGYIDFAPLNSSLSPRNPTSKETRDKVYKDSLEAARTLPLPASPKSVFRLAHLLQLPELQELALGALVASLTVEGAACELFSPVALAYDEVRDAVREFVLDHVGEVSATAAWKEASTKAAQRSTEDALMVMMELFEGLGVSA